MQNSKNFNAQASDKRWTNMMGVVKTKRQELAKLAPSPDRAGQKAPLSVKDNTVAANDERDGMMGAIVLESLFGACFGGAITDALNMPDSLQGMNWSHAVQAYDEVRRDWADENTNADNQISAGSYSDQFNVVVRPKMQKSAVDMAWDRYLADLPNRRVLEQSIGSLNREMEKREMAWLQPQSMAMSR